MWVINEIQNNFWDPAMKWIQVILGNNEGLKPGLSAGLRPVETPGDADVGVGVVENMWLSLNHFAKCGLYWQTELSFLLSTPDPLRQLLSEATGQ